MKTRVFYKLNGVRVSGYHLEKLFGHAETTRVTNTALELLSNGVESGCRFFTCEGLLKVRAGQPV